MINEAHRLEEEDHIAKSIVSAQMELEENIFTLQQKISSVDDPIIKKEFAEFAGSVEAWILTNPRNLTLFQQKLEEINNLRRKYNL